MSEPVHGDAEFILVGMNTILDREVDMVYHMRSSRDPEQRLRRSIPNPKPKRRRRPLKDNPEATVLATEMSAEAEKEITPASFEQCSCDTRVVRNMAHSEYMAYVRGLLDKPETAALFPTWVNVANPDDAYHQVATPQPDAVCCMTEMQLQAILDSKADIDGELDVDMTTTKGGVKISKFSLDAISIGKDVPPTLLIFF